MNDNEDILIAQLERELRSLEPLAPDPLLCGKLERRMEGQPAAEVAKKAPASRRTLREFSHRHRWAPWAAAAVVTAAVTVPQFLLRRAAPLADNGNGTEPVIASRPGAPPAPPTRSSFQPVRREVVFQDMPPAEIVNDPVRGPVYRVRLNYKENQEFHDPNSNSTLRIQLPFQGVYEVPAEVQ